MILICKQDNSIEAYKRSTLENVFMISVLFDHNHKILTRMSHVLVGLWSSDALTRQDIRTIIVTMSMLTMQSRSK